MVHDTFSSGNSTGMVLLDMKSAIDTVWHNGLIYEMFKVNLYEIIKIMLSVLRERLFFVSIGSYYSEIIAGCPHGSSISPILYYIYTSDIPRLHCYKSARTSYLKWYMTIRGYILRNEYIIWHDLSLFCKTFGSDQMKSRLLSSCTTPLYKPCFLSGITWIHY